MKSLRTKITLLTVCAMVIPMVIAMTLGVVAIRGIGNNNSRQSLLLLCEVGQKNLDYYFDNVERSVEMVSTYVETDLHVLGDQQLQEHIDHVSDFFKRMTYHTNGILTYYYRIDPSISTTARGFWYVNSDGSGFKEHEVTDITQYNTDDTSKLVWFTVPKSTGKPIWLPPYITENLGARVISYNVPIYLNDQFIGVVGIEIDYSTMANQVNNITLYENGYAFVYDSDGNVIYHPKVDILALDEDQKLTVPDSLLENKTFTRYQYDGVKKLAATLPLSNNMYLCVSVPISEIDANWRTWATNILLIFALLLAIFLLLVTRFSESITKPLTELSQVAEQVSAGNYDFVLNYRGHDEVGKLTQAFAKLVAHLKTYIRDLNDLAYADALTSVHNKGSFDIHVSELQAQLASQDAPLEFGMCVFDCNSLKSINDHYGHEMGDIYLKTACSTICHVFAHSPVFRTGGDEFAVILRNSDFDRRTELLQKLDEATEQNNAAAEHPWEKVNVARGLAVYDPNTDKSVHDTIRRADKLMYEDKFRQKSHHI